MAGGKQGGKFDDAYIYCFCAITPFCMIMILRQRRVTFRHIHPLMLVLFKTQPSDNYPSLEQYINDIEGESTNADRGTETGLRNEKENMEASELRNGLIVRLSPLPNTSMPFLGISVIQVDVFHRASISAVAPQSMVTIMVIISMGAIWPIPTVGWT
jgi:hypothetical protein